MRRAGILAVYDLVKILWVINICRLQLETPFNAVSCSIADRSNNQFVVLLDYEHAQVNHSANKKSAGCVANRAELPRVNRNK